jgi:hypothetical protein
VMHGAWHGRATTCDKWKGYGGSTLTSEREASDAKN